MYLISFAYVCLDDMYFYRNFDFTLGTLLRYVVNGPSLALVQPVLLATVLSGGLTYVGVRALQSYVGWSLIVLPAFRAKINQRPKV